MAWPSIDRRHAYIRELVDSGIDILTIKHNEIAEMFGCSEGAIKADIVNYTSNRGGAIIYALCDPDTNEVRYIGQTSWKLETRVTAHVRDSRNGKETNAQKREWLESLSTNRKGPLAKILERCDPQMANERERWWIDHYRDERASLLNIAYNGFAISEGDSFLVTRQDKVGVANDGAWKVTEITRTHVILTDQTDGTQYKLAR